MNQEFLKTLREHLEKFKKMGKEIYSARINENLTDEQIQDKINEILTRDRDEKLRKDKEKYKKLYEYQNSLGISDYETLRLSTSDKLLKSKFAKLFRKDSNYEDLLYAIKN